MKNEKDLLRMVSHINIDFSSTPPILSVYSKSKKVIFSAEIDNGDMKPVQAFLKDVLQNKCQSQ